jgi:hypothetical protein
MCVWQYKDENIVPDYGICPWHGRPAVSAHWFSALLIWYVWPLVIRTVMMGYLLKVYCNPGCIHGFLFSWINEIFIRNMCGCLGKPVGSNWASFWVMSKKNLFKNWIMWGPGDDQVVGHWPACKISQILQLFFIFIFNFTKNCSYKKCQHVVSRVWIERYYHNLNLIYKLSVFLHFHIFFQALNTPFSWLFRNS